MSGTFGKATCLPLFHTVSEIRERTIDSMGKVALKLLAVEWNNNSHHVFPERGRPQRHRCWMTIVYTADDPAGLPAQLNKHPQSLHPLHGLDNEVDRKIEVGYS
jgi:hypothetical protein